MRGAMRNKERWKGRRTPTQDPGTDLALRSYEKARHEDDLAALADECSDTQRQLQAAEAECARLRDANDFLQASLPSQYKRVLEYLSRCGIR